MTAETEPPLVRWARRVTTQRLLVAATLLAAAAYGCTYLAAFGYLVRLGFAPDELSISYSTLLPRAVAGIVMPLALCGAFGILFGSVTHWRLMVANERAAKAGLPGVDHAKVAFYDWVGAVMLPTMWVLGAELTLVLLSYTYTPPVTTLDSVAAWTALVTFPLLLGALTQGVITRAALWDSRRARARVPKERGRRDPSAVGTIGALAVACALVVVPAFGGSYALGSFVAGRLAASGDLTPQRVDYSLFSSWTPGLMLPQVTCVEVAWAGAPVPTQVPVGPSLHVGTSSDVALLYDLDRERAVRLYVGTVILVSLPDERCARKTRTRQERLPG
ncbi:MAG: hypothetical protein ACR2K2_09460 [Mycobacteriales bacterium]